MRILRESSSVRFGSFRSDSSLVFAYYKDGAANPTFLYFGDALKEVKC